MRTLRVAVREFRSVVMTKGFVIGVLMTPAAMALAIGAIALMKQAGSPRVVGTLVVVDRSGAAASRVSERFTAAAIEEEDRAISREVESKVRGSAGGLASEEQLGQAQAITRAQLANRADVTVEIAPAETDVKALSDQLAKTRFGAGDAAANRPLIAVAVIPEGAVRPDSGGKYAALEVYLAPRLDFEIQRRVERRILGAVVDARIATDPRLVSSGLSAQTIRAVMETPDLQSITVTASGNRKSLGEAQFLVPMAFMILMLISVMTTGAYLMTTVVEEKSNRVMEVLLSAVSPLQLMLGKILGHMAVGVVILIVYGGLGIVGLIAFALAGLVSPGMLALLVIYFLIAALTMAALMAAVGSAVNDIREAQTLQTPVMMLVMLPWLAWMYIQRAPNSLPVTIASFIPGLNPFVMVIRMNGSEPIPAWQYPASIVMGALGAVGAVWLSAKVFRIGVLMYGKPPDFRTLIKWVRMA